MFIPVRNDRAGDRIPDIRMSFQFINSGCIDIDLFDNGISAGFYCSFLAAYSNWAVATGTQGHLRVPDFVLPKNSSEGALEINGIASDDLMVDPVRAQEANMVRAFSEQVLSGKLNDSWPDWALKTQIVANACLDSTRAGRPVSL